MKAALKQVVKTGDPDAIIRHCNAALARFEEIGFPDSWSDWERAKEDAEFQKRLRSKWNPRRKKYSVRKNYKKYGKRTKATRRRKSRKGKR